MRLLLDTHVAIWAIADSPRLSNAGRDLILSRENEIHVSAASIWEISIKHALGRGDMPISGEDALAYFRQAGYRLLSVSPGHAAMVERLPVLHQDPFDRLLVAQSLAEPLRLLTHDRQVVAYSDSIIEI